MVREFQLLLVKELTTPIDLGTPRNTPMRKFPLHCYYADMSSVSNSNT